MFLAKLFSASVIIIFALFCTMFRRRRLPENVERARPKANWSSAESDWVWRGGFPLPSWGIRGSVVSSLSGVQAPAAHRFVLYLWRNESWNAFYPGYKNAWKLSEFCMRGRARGWMIWGPLASNTDCPYASSDVQAIGLPYFGNSDSLILV